VALFKVDIMSEKVTTVTGSSSGFGRLISEALAHTGHRVDASMREIDGKMQSTLLLLFATF
jgi:NADP-dependent 3-hydroxy acid dehydrogenase YdfG